jgi:uncharacterized protein YjbJ (UPF0337 family)
MFERSCLGRWTRISRCSPDRKELAVSASKKAKDKTQAVKGKVKKGTGKALGDPVLEGKGKAEQAKGNLKQAGEKVKDAARK